MLCGKKTIFAKCKLLIRHHVFGHDKKRTLQGKVFIKTILGYNQKVPSRAMYLLKTIWVRLKVTFQGKIPFLAAVRQTTAVKHAVAVR